jgi:hypothetical protein
MCIVGVCSRWSGKDMDPDLRLRPERAENVECRHTQLNRDAALHVGRCLTLCLHTISILPTICVCTFNPLGQLYTAISINTIPNMSGTERPTTPPRAPAPTTAITPEQVRRMEEARLRAKALRSQHQQNQSSRPSTPPAMSKHPPKSQAKSGQRPTPSHLPSETQAATMAHHPPPTTTPRSAPRANSKNSSTTTSAK